MSVRTRNSVHLTARWFTPVWLAIVTMVVGCQAIGSGGADELAASAVRDPILVDIPKPQGFVLVDNETTAFASGKFRVARCEYVGATAREAIKRFYEQYMPQASFALREWRLIGGVYNMRFESTTEVCTVEISAVGAKTVLIVEITPKPQGSTERDTDPPLRRQE